MNKIEFKLSGQEVNRLGQMIVTLLQPATVDNFRYKLTDLPELTTLNCPRDCLFSQVSDLLTCKDIIAEIGEWVVAEVEGTQVQFNKLSKNEGPLGQGLEDTLVSILKPHVSGSASFLHVMKGSPLERFAQHLRWFNDLEDALKSEQVVKAVGRWGFAEDPETPDDDTNIWFEKVVGSRK